MTVIKDTIAKVDRPVFLVPRGFVHRRPNAQRTGHQILIAWNGSAASARAIHDGLTLLRRAEEATVFNVNERRKPNGAHRVVKMMAGHLARHNIRARGEVTQTRNASVSRPHFRPANWKSIFW